MVHSLSTTDLRCLFGGMTREQLERMLAQLAATAPEQFDIALNITTEM